MENDKFIREVVDQLLPYITEMVNEEVEYVDEYGNTKSDLKHIYESAGAVVIDLDDLMLEDPVWWK